MMALIQARQESQACLYDCEHTNYLCSMLTDMGSAFESLDSAAQPMYCSVCHQIACVPGSSAPLADRLGINSWRYCRGFWHAHKPASSHSQAENASSGAVAGGSGTHKPASHTEIASSGGSRKPRFMPDGSRAGQVTGSELAAELKAKAQREAKQFAALGTQLTGRGADTVSLSCSPCQQASQHQCLKHT